ncbi:unnamed protein product [Rotaria sp. Silwood1]|nr:unnamed protein product [Rotaria sp. Silwood1]
MAAFHFWIGTLGIVFYAASLYWAGITQSLMWKQFTPLGILQYPNFLETVIQIIPMYMIRAFGGALYLTGVVVMVINLIKTAKSGVLEANEPAEAPALEKDYVDKSTKHRWLETRPGKFALLATVAIIIGGAIEMIPTFMIKSNIPTIPSAEELATDLQKNGAPAQSNKEIIALIAYLQRMGTGIKGDTTTVK